MPDEPGRLRRIVVLLRPVGIIFFAWAALDELANRGRRLSPAVIGSAWFQVLAAAVLALILAAGWLVALRGALRSHGRARMAHAASALLFAVFCLVPAVSHVYVGEMLGEAVALLQNTTLGEDPRLAELQERAWTGKDATSRQSVAKAIYRLNGTRIVYRDETGAGRLYEPTADLARQTQQNTENMAEVRSSAALLALNAPHSFRLAYAYLVGVAVMLLGSLLLAVRRQRGVGGVQTPDDASHSTTLRSLT